VVALRHDVDVMGIGSRLADAVGVVDDAGFVDLVVRHSPVVSWS
jgi:sulfur relay protein TusB/DsrH